MSEFLTFALDMWPVIALVIAAYFAARIVGNGNRIRLFRAQDQNEGRHLEAGS